MEMKINFDQLFGPGHELNTTHETPSSDFENSFQASLNHSFQYKLTFNQQIFDPNDIDHEPIKFIDSREISEDVKSSYTKKSVKSKQSDKSINHPVPGYRLYYESQESQIRKNKERQKIQSEKQAKIKSLPFAPTINKNSRKLAQKVRNEGKEVIKQKKEHLKSTIQVKEQQLLKECTFQPKLIAKSNKAQTKSRQELFYYLHNTSKLKELQNMRRSEQEMMESKLKKMPKQQFNNFLKRTEQYASIVKKKHQILKQNVEQYDSKTGQKLYSPKITDKKCQQYFTKSPSVNDFKQQQKSLQTQKNQASKNMFESVSMQPKLKSGIFKKKTIQISKFQDSQQSCKSDSKYDSDAKYSKDEPSAKIPKQLPPDQQTDYNQQYQKYIQQFDRRAALREASLSNHQIIPEEEQHSIQDMSKQQDRGNHQQDQSWSVDNVEVEDEKIQQFNPDEAVGQEGNLWGSSQIKPFQLSNVNQYLAASEEDEHEPRNNYVMDILNNLIGGKQDQE